MIIKDVTIRNFGKLQNRTFTFSEGLNVIYGPNEAGKSTLQVFLKSMLFGLEKTRVRNRLDEYQKYEPWETPAEFSGSLHFETGGQLFYLERSFYRKDRRDILKNEGDGEELSVAQGDLAMLLGNVSRQTYENTWSIGQKAAAADPAALEGMQDPAGGMGDGTAGGVQILQADAYFEKEKKALKRQLKEAEKEQEYLEKVRQEKEELLQDDLESIRKQKAEKEMLLKRLENRQAAFMERRGEFSDSPERNKQKEQNVHREQNAQRGQNKQREQNAYREQDEQRGQRKASVSARVSAENPGGQEEGQPHRSRWNVMMTAGVLLFLIFGLLGRSGSIPHPAARILCVISGILVAVGVVQETRKQKQMADSEERQRPHERQMRDSKEVQRRNANRTDYRESVPGDPEAAGSPAGIPVDTAGKSGSASGAEDSWSREHEQRLSHARAAVDILTEQEREKETEFYNLTGSREAEQENLQKQKDLQRELSAVSLAQDTVRQLVREKSSSQIRALEGEAASILAEITGISPEAAGLDGHLQPTVEEAGKSRRPEAMSGGTADQIWFAWRMAAGKYAASREPLLFLLDEPFAYYDDERLEQTLRWLARQGQQILLFTCTKREMDCLDRIGVVYRKLEMS